jgi:hypothetical protein
LFRVRENSGLLIIETLQQVVWGNLKVATVAPVLVPQEI